jgi:hypothetical protein
MVDDDDPLAIPASLKRGSDNKAEFHKMANAQTEEVAPKTPKAPKAKANGTVKAAPKKAVKAAAKPAKKAAAVKKAPASKGSEKPKAAKPKTDTVKKDKWGFREGTAKSKAVALYAAKGGATLEEVKEAVGSVQLNVLNGLEAEGHTVDRKKEVRDGQRPVTRYFLKAKKD